jgi:hypothetical protein
LIPKQDVGLATLATRTCINLVSRVLAHTFEFSVSRSRSHRTIYYLGYPLGRFAGLKHQQLAHRVGVIITTGRIRRTLVNKINLLVDSTRSIESSRLALVKAESIFLRRTSGCFSASRGSSCRSSSTNPPRAGSSSTTSPPPHVWVPRHIARLVTRLVAPLVIDYSVSRRLIVDYPTSRRLVVDNSTSRRLVVDYFTSAARPGASARRVARHVARRTARRRLLRLVQARRRLLRLCRASGCLGTSRGSSRGSSRRSSLTTPRHAGSSSTASPTPHVRLLRHVARLVV